MKNKIMNTLLLFLSFAAAHMASVSLSEVSSAGWYQPEIDETVLKNNLKK